MHMIQTHMNIKISQWDTSLWCKIFLFKYSSKNQTTNIIYFKKFIWSINTLKTKQKKLKLVYINIKLKKCCFPEISSMDIMHNEFSFPNFVHDLVIFWIQNYKKKHTLYLNKIPLITLV